MSDDNNGGMGNFPFAFLQPSPEDIQRMREAHDRQHLAIDEFQHTQARFVNSLNMEQATALKNMLHIIAVNAEDDSKGIPAYYEGIVTGILQGRFNVCLACDKDHDKIIADEFTPSESESGNEPAPKDGGDPFKPADPTPDLQVGQEGMLSDQQIKNMQEYNLDDLRDEDTGVLIGFVCLDCGLRYVSIEDRMLKPVDGCHGCQMKAAHG